VTKLVKDQIVSACCIVCCVVFLFLWGSNESFPFKQHSSIVVCCHTSIGWIYVVIVARTIKMKKKFSPIFLFNLDQHTVGALLVIVYIYVSMV
jgi:hypothetical protein